jgi:hypothetical protein
MACQHAYAEKSALQFQEKLFMFVIISYLFRLMDCNISFLLPES